MSPLTKLFVVLLVVLSLLLSAATIVFVNVSTDYKGQMAILTTQKEAAVAEKQRLVAEQETIRANADAEKGAAARRVEGIQQDLNKRGQELISAQTALAQATNQSQIAAVSNTSLAGALQGAQNTLSAIQAQLSEIRAANDKFATQNEQLNLAVTDLTNRLDVTERERRLLSEQLTEARGQSDKQGAMLRDMGVSPAQLASAGTRLSAPAINGVIRDVKPIYGVQYARISVGSADNVVKGMQFNVINHDTQQFLGKLTVETVEQNEATGRLEGPLVGQVRTGAEVKTQLN